MFSATALLHVFKLCFSEAVFLILLIRRIRCQGAGFFFLKGKGKKKGKCVLALLMHQKTERPHIHAFSFLGVSEYVCISVCVCTVCMFMTGWLMSFKKNVLINSLFLWLISSPPCWRERRPDGACGTHQTLCPVCVWCALDRCVKSDCEF